MNQRFNSLAKIALPLLLIAMALLAWLIWRGGELALSLEHAPLAWLQCMMLTACAITAFHLALFKHNEQLLWCVIAGALLFCALDEKFMFHESLQVFIYSHYLMPSPKMSFLIHTLTLIYAVGGLICLYWLHYSYWQHCKVYKHTFLTLCLAVLTGCAAIGLDIVFDNVHIQAYEEVLEYLAETIFLIGLSHELQQRLTNQRVGQSPNSPE